MSEQHLHTDPAPKTPLGGVKAFACRNCGGQVELRAPGQTLAASCPFCGTISDLTDENFRIIQQANDKMSREPLIPLGTRGEYEGKQWEVIGFMVREAMGYDYFWEEYLLFNPIYGFRWLVNNYGHWSWVEPMVVWPEYHSSLRTAKMGKQSFKKFTSGKARVVYVLGEFYWQVRTGEKVGTVDLVDPPFMLSMERDKKSSSWSKGKYMETYEVKAIFGPRLKLPRARGVGMNQPNKFRQQLRQVLPIWIAALALVIGLQILFSSGSSDDLVYKGDVTAGDSLTTFVSPPLELKGDLSNAEILLTSPTLMNSWVEVEGYLHNLETGENYGFVLPLEYYAGVTDGESWSEGSTSGSRFLNEIPGGKYELVLNMIAEKDYTNLRIGLRRDVPYFSNMFMVLIIISIFPIVLLFRSGDFEKRRWAEAD